MARAVYNKVGFKSSGHLTEDQCKYRLFNQPKVKNWSALVERGRLTELSNQRPHRLIEFLAAMSQEDMEWDEIPNSEILDRMFGIDCPINYMGSLLGVDITADATHQKLVDKRRNLERLEFESPIEGLIATAVWVINPNCPPTGEEMLDCIKAMRCQRNFCQVYYL